jgi:sigma-B regulation protein RsbU (phosphoserine phosphatase)
MEPDLKELARKNLQALVEEIKNFQDIAHNLTPDPGEIPELPGVDIHGETIPMTGLIGGDHIIYLDFQKRYDLDARIRAARKAGRADLAEELERNKHQAGILLADVSGHRITDALITAMLHQAFLLGVQYELEIFGTITTRLFENINNRFYQSSIVGKFLTMIYGEITDRGMFRFLSAAHPPPIVFSNEFDHIVDIQADRLITLPPIGTMLNKDDVDRGRRAQSPLGLVEGYTINEISLMSQGDLMILYSDGLTDHESPSGERYFPVRLEAYLRAHKGESAAAICHALRRDLLEFGPPADDISFVVVKRT